MFIPRKASTFCDHNTAGCEKILRGAFQELAGVGKGNNFRGENFCDRALT
jgi:hypothetical protein